MIKRKKEKEKGKGVRAAPCWLLGLNGGDASWRWWPYYRACVATGTAYWYTVLVEQSGATISYMEYSVLRTFQIVHVHRACVSTGTVQRRAEWCDVVICDASPFVFLHLFVENRNGTTRRCPKFNVFWRPAFDFPRTKQGIRGSIETCYKKPHIATRNIHACGLHLFTAQKQHTRDRRSKVEIDVVSSN